ncbi:YitT family protein [Clostridium botulinum]|uniref:Membrane protein n=1 Tax=Clostridium botulinum C/D str. DC5 TaxID=1443128 RepID=A0A0A0IJG6_CLOBO|nr:YitT family protein [Clostridium botulinum]KEI06145.1 membrane protein [Clostridium botulinum C/D str. BKT75002]KEI08089.1 membrane protein [Clostridium botulinum C/D str. BKT2873]KGM93994.1 membrane protein [Clostridium botulinum D str. CCUG 7971]KGM99685.1 membrane protein [Clostridium botulinum C/D str. DC5]KOC50250.1 hypothetical protein ADU88_03280 [Clostridium botulinum]
MIVKFLNMSGKELSKKTVLILFGSLLNAIALNLFLIPSNLLSGGVSGISLILLYLFNLPVGVSLLLLNIPLLILCFFKTDKKFTFFTLIGTLSLSLIIIITEPLSKILVPSATNRLLYSIYGGVLSGLGVGIIFSNHGSTGGIDIISMIAKKKYNIDVGFASFVLNLIIVSAGSSFLGIETGLYTLIMMYITGAFTDRVLRGFSKQKMLIIVTKKQQEMTSAIMHKLHRGITILYGEGAYTKEKINILYCVVSPRQVPRIKELVIEIDDKAFISITDTAEVQGQGFAKLP